MTLREHLDLTEAALLHCVTAVAQAFGPRYGQLKEELVKEESIHGDETSWRIKGKNHWLWAFLGKWSVVYEVDESRGKHVPKKVLGDYRGIVISDSWGAWNHIGVRWQRCLVHYLRELEDTIKYNCFSRMGDYAFNIGGSNDVLDYNEIYQTNYAKDPGCGCSGGGKWWGTLNADIVGNAWIDDGPGGGGPIWLDNGNSGRSGHPSPPATSQRRCAFLTRSHPPQSV